MSLIKKNFVVKKVSHGAECNHYVMEDMDMTYEEAVIDFKEKHSSKVYCNPWYYGVYLIEKTFDPETFIITTKIIKSTHLGPNRMSIIEDN